MTFEKWWEKWLATQTGDFNPKHSAKAAYLAAGTIGAQQVLDAVQHRLNEIQIELDTANV
jgi:hypothetical protein